MYGMKLVEPIPGFVEADMPSDVIFMVDEVFDMGGEDFEREAKLLWPVDTSVSRDTIRHYSTGYMNHYVECGEPYGVVVEYGRRPGQPPPPYKDLIPWCTRVLGDPGAAYPVARKIGREGTEGKFVFATVAEDIFPQIERDLNTAMVELMVDKWK